MPSKRTMRKEKPAEIMKRLMRLGKRIRRDEEAFAKIRQEWYSEYLNHTGAIEYFKKNNLSNVCSQYDLEYETMPELAIERAINVVQEHFIKSLESKNTVDIPSVI
jgi:hypothetical protein